MKGRLLIVGASVRAAAFSALRAGLKPWCADLFADADLRKHCETIRITEGYPGAFEELLRQDHTEAWMYTGGLENHPELIDRMARLRPLWGNAGGVLRLARDPLLLSETAQAAGLRAPNVLLPPATPRLGSWLIKRRSASAGIGIRQWHETAPVDPSRDYLQEFIAGASASVTYLAADNRCWILGVTLQLIGEDWLGAGPFRYCGNIGPIAVNEQTRSRLLRFGEMLAARTGLRGLFGVDGILLDEDFAPVEVNPRYTASVEVLEYAGGFPALHWHRLAFEQPALPPADPLSSAMFSPVGKAILFAPKEILFPEIGPWLDDLAPERSVADMPTFADIPDPGAVSLAGRPLVTVLARGRSVGEVRSALRQRVADVLERLG